MDGVARRVVADAGDLRLVRQQPGEAEAGPSGDARGEVGGLVGLADGERSAPALNLPPKAT
ncbi:hypothetical protein GCM10020001_066860 [Nonomuraea salmonea]